MREDHITGYQKQTATLTHNVKNIFGNFLLQVACHLLQRTTSIKYEVTTR